MPVRNTVVRLEGVAPAKKENAHFEATEFGLDLDSAVRLGISLPTDMDEDVWILTQFSRAFEEIQQVFCLADDMCMECKRMSAGRQVCYKWADEQNPEPEVLSARQYMRELQHYTFMQLQCGALCSRDGTTFALDFRERIGMMLRRFFRIYAHIYLEHYEVLRCHGMVPHFNYYFKRLLFFILEFELVPLAELETLSLIIKKFQLQEDGRD